MSRSLLLGLLWSSSLLSSGSVTTLSSGSVSLSSGSVSLSSLRLGEGVLSFIIFVSSSSLGLSVFLMLVHFVQLDDVDFGSLDNLDLSDGDVLEWEDLLAFLGDFFSDLLHGESLDDLIDGLFSDLVVQ